MRVKHWITVILNGRKFAKFATPSSRVSLWMDKGFNCQILCISLGAWTRLVGVYRWIP